MKTFKEIREAGLWANIHAKRKRGEKMRKKGEKGAPTPEAIRAAQREERVPQDPDIKDKKGSQPKVYHAGIKSKDTKAARDSQFKKQSKMSDDNPAAYKDAPGDKAARKKGMPISPNTAYVRKMMDEDKAGSSFDKKSAKSGISSGTLRKVYNRGVAAWKTGHRPGTTPSQWGHARVNAFIRKKKQGGLNHDKDLA